MSGSGEYGALIDPAELAAILGEPSTVTFDVRFALQDPSAGRRLYDADHIPGASYLDLDQELSGPLTATSGRHPLPDAEILAENLRATGVSAESQVVAYDESSSAFAARLWWLLRWLGHDRVAVLNGGYTRWKEGGYPVTADLRQPARGNLQPHARGEMVVTAEDVMALRREGGDVLVDARAAERFRGEVEPIDTIAGHIPGAVNLPFLGNLADDGTFLSVAELKGRHVQTHAVHMCGSGVTGCHNVLASYIAGNRLPRLFVGSWSEWITDESRPVAVGD